MRGIHQRNALKAVLLNRVRNIILSDGYITTLSIEILFSECGLNKMYLKYFESKISSPDNQIKNIHLARRIKLFYPEDREPVQSIIEKEKEKLRSTSSPER